MKTSVCAEECGSRVELQASISASANVEASEPPSAFGTAENEDAVSVEIVTEQPSTSFVKPIDRTSTDVCFRYSSTTFNFDSVKVMQFLCRFPMHCSTIFTSKRYDVSHLSI